MKRLKVESLKVWSWFLGRLPLTHVRRGRSSLIHWQTGLGPGPWDAANSNQAQRLGSSSAALDLQSFLGSLLLLYGRCDVMWYDDTKQCRMMWWCGVGMRSKCCPMLVLQIRCPISLEFKLFEISYGIMPWHLLFLSIYFHFLWLLNHTSLLFHSLAWWKKQYGEDPAKGKVGGQLGRILVQLRDLQTR